MVSKSALHYRARKVWITAHGSGPWSCGSCDELVPKIGRRRGEGHVHHCDGDDANNDLSNLEVLHQRCHALIHIPLTHLGAKRSAETRARISASLQGVGLGKPKTPEHAAAISRGLKGKYVGRKLGPMPQAQRDAISRGRQRYFEERRKCS